MDLSSICILFEGSIQSSVSKEELVFKFRDTNVLLSFRLESFVIVCYRGIDYLPNLFQKLW